MPGHKIGFGHRNDVCAIGMGVDTGAHQGLYLDLIAADLAGRVRDHACGRDNGKPFRRGNADGGGQRGQPNQKERKRIATLSYAYENEYANDLQKSMRLRFILKKHIIMLILFLN